MLGLKLAGGGQLLLAEVEPDRPSAEAVKPGAPVPGAAAEIEHVEPRQVRKDLAASSSGTSHIPHQGVGLAHALRPLATQFGASAFQLSRLRAAWVVRSSSSASHGERSLGAAAGTEGDLRQLTGYIAVK